MSNPDASEKRGSVKVEGEDAVLHITDQSVMFEKGGKVSGFERSAIRMVKPDGDAMIIAYSAGSEVKSVRVEPMTAVATLLMPQTLSGSTQNGPQWTANRSSLDELFERVYIETRKELEERLARVQEDPANKSLRLTPEEEARYSGVCRQMENIVGAKYGFDPNARLDNDYPITFWGLEKRPYELQLDVIKIRHIAFLYMIVDSTAEKNDVAYSTNQVWPEDWPHILGHFNLGSHPYTTEMFNGYVNYLKSHWKYRPGERKPVLARS